MQGSAQVNELSNSILDITLTYGSSYGLGVDSSPGTSQGFRYTYFEFDLPWLTINSCNSGQTTHYSSWRTGGHSWRDDRCDRRSSTRFRLYYDTNYFERQLNEGGSARTVNSGHYIRFRVVGSFTIDDSTSPDSYYVSAVHYSRERDNYYAYVSDCGRCSYSCDYYNCWCNTCSYRSFSWESRQAFTGSSSARYDEQASAGSAGATLLSYRSGILSELNFYLIGAATSIGGSNLLVGLLEGSWSNNNPFPYTYNSDFGAQIDCLCSASTSTASTVFPAATCYRYLQGNPFITVDVSISSGGNVRCYFPGFMVPNSNFDVQVGIMNEQVRFDFFESLNLYYLSNGGTESVSSYSYSTQISLSDNMYSSSNRQTGTSQSYSLTMNNFGN